MHPQRPKGVLPKEVLELIEAGKLPDFRGPTIREILLGKENPSEEELESLNLIHYLRADMPPVFAFGSYRDSLCDETVKDKEEVDGLNMQKWPEMSLAFIEQN